MTAGPNIFEHSDIKRCLKKMICVGRVGLGFYCVSTIQALSGYIIYFCLFHLALSALFNLFFLIKVYAIKIYAIIIISTEQLHTRQQKTI